MPVVTDHPASFGVDAPRNREELVGRLADLRGQGILDAAEEASILEHLDRMIRDTEEEKAQLEPEYLRRVKTDGKDAADAWLQEIAFEFGRRQGEVTKAIIDRLRVVTG